MQVICNNITYKTKKEFAIYVRNLIYMVIGVCDDVAKHKNYFELLEVLKRHPDFEEKMDNLKTMRIQKESFNDGRQIVIVKNDNTEAVISFITAINGEGMSIHNMLRDAMRSSVHEQIQTFRAKGGSFCAICNSTEKPEVDHLLRFTEMVVAFLSNRTDIPSKFDKLNEPMRRHCFLEEDCLFREDWVEYHRMNATMRMLCRRCNLQRIKKKHVQTTTNPLKD
jgi:hypothetical protein